jgi:hypothetical protein
VHIGAITRGPAQSHTLTRTLVPISKGVLLTMEAPLPSIQTARANCCWIKYIYVVILWICLCVDTGYGLYGHDQSDYFGECNKFLYSSTIEPPLHRLLELHIRLNFRVSL